MSDWQDISTAPKQIVSSYDGSQYGAYILAYPINGRVARVRWWQSDKEQYRKQGYQNFLGDCGNAYRPTHWMPLPKAPDTPSGSD